MPYETITVDVTDHIAKITLNRPERMNACSLDMAGEINDALSSMQGVRALIITGAGRASVRARTSPRGATGRSTAARAATSR